MHIINKWSNLHFICINYADHTCLMGIWVSILFRVSMISAIAGLLFVWESTQCIDNSMHVFTWCISSNWYFDVALIIVLQLVSTYKTGIERYVLRRTINKEVWCMILVLAFKCTNIYSNGKYVMWEEKFHHIHQSKVSHMLPYIQYIFAQKCYIWQSR